LAILPMAFATHADPVAGQPSPEINSSPTLPPQSNTHSQAHMHRVSNKRFSGTAKHTVGRNGRVLVNQIARRSLSDGIDGELEFERRDGGFGGIGFETVEELAERNLDFDSELEERDFDPEEEIEELFARHLDFEVEELLKKRDFEPEEDLELFERDEFEMEHELLERDFEPESELELAERSAEDELD